MDAVDTTTEPVVRAALTLAGLDPDDRDSPTYKQAFREPIHEALLAIAAANLDHLSVVIVAPFTRELRQDPEQERDFPLPKKQVTAFAMSPNRVVFLAFANQIVFGAIP